MVENRLIMREIVEYDGRFGLNDSSVRDRTLHTGIRIRHSGR